MKTVIKNVSKILLKSYENWMNSEMLWNSFWMKWKIRFSIKENILNEWQTNEIYNYYYNY